MKLLIPFIVGIQVFILVPTVRSDVKSCYNFAHFSATSIITCYDRHGNEIPCTDQLLEGAVAKQRCRDNFHPDQKLETNDYNATCKHGTWDKEFFNCIPSCGKANNVIGLLAGGKRETRGGSPWYVAIYSSEKSEIPKLICGGTLINEELVVSAAHCFYDETFDRNKDPKFFHAIVAKATSNYTIKDYESTKIYQFKNIFFPRAFKGSRTAYASDIVIIHLTEKVTFSQDVFPACLQPNINDGFNPGEKVGGKLSGFGQISDGSYPSELLTASLPFISYDECLKVVREDFISFLSLDKFCAGNETGAGARAGDSGGGLLFVDKGNGLYYLRGVVSNRDSRESSIAALTDVAQYTHWIARVMKSIEPKSNDECSKLNKTLKDSDCVVTYKCTIFNETTYNDAVVYCGLDIDTGAVKICCPKRFRRLVKQETRKDPNYIIWEKCVEYASARYVTTAPGNQNQSNITSRKRDCVPDEPLPPGRTNVKSKEFPHMALIGFTYLPEMKVNDSYWECIGSLISDRYVLTSAYCITVGGRRANWVRLGEMEIYNDNDGASPNDFPIAERIPHPQHEISSIFEFDIALLKLQNRVIFTPHMRPICLYTSVAVALSSNDRVLITGWIAPHLGEARGRHPWKAPNIISDSKKCITYYQSHTKIVIGIDPISMICAEGNASEGKICDFDSGGPLQMPIPDWACMYWLVGIGSMYQPVLCGQKGYPHTYSRVSYFIPWIQSIVWP